MPQPSNYVRRLRRILRGTPLAPHARLIAQVEARNRLPRGTIAGIAKAESSFGTAGSPTRGFNAWGWTNGGPPNFRSFPNWQTAIRQYGRFLGSSYGDTLRSGGPDAIARRYVGYAAPHWVTNVRSVMEQVGSGVPTSPGRAGSRTGSRTPARADTKKDKLMLLMAMMAMRENNPASTLAAIGIISNLRGQQGRPRTVRGHRTGGRAPQVYSGRGLQLPSSISSTHSTSGLAGYPAYDFMARGGTAVYAPVDGVVSKEHPFGWLSYQNPSKGFGGARLYIDGGNGRTYYIAHMAKNLRVRPGERIRKGQLLGYVWDWPNDPGRSHVHMGVHSG